MKKIKENNPNFVDNLRTVRLALGFSQQKMADMLEIDRSAYSYYESGKSGLSVYRLKKILDIFNSKCSNEKVSFEMLFSERLDYLTIKNKLLGYSDKEA